MTPPTESDLIRSGMARAFFASAWADQCEETGHAAMLAGQEITKLMPTEYDPAAWAAARTLLFDMERLNESDIASIYLANDGHLTAVDWGHYAAMQAMGHGTGLWEFVGQGVAVPFVEFGSYALANDYFHPVQP